MTDTLTLVSHAGSRAHAPYGPTEHPVVEGAVELVTWTQPARYGDGTDTTTLVELDGRVWVRTPLTQALHDVEVDGDVVRFDGDLPGDGGCHGPEIRLDGEHLFTPLRAGLPLLVIETERSLFGISSRKAKVRYWDVTDPARFARGAVDGKLPDSTRTFDLPGPTDQRCVFTLPEADLLPGGILDRLSVTVHDRAAAIRHLHPVRSLHEQLQHRRTEAAAVRDRLEQMAARIDVVLHTGRAPEHYRVPSSGTESPYDTFGVSTRAVDTYLATSVALDLFARPARATW